MHSTQPRDPPDLVECAVEKSQAAVAVAVAETHSQSLQRRNDMSAVGLAEEVLEVAEVARNLVAHMFVVSLLLADCHRCYKVYLAGQRMSV